MAYSEQNHTATILALCENRGPEIGLAALSYRCPTLILSQFCDATTYFNTLSMIMFHNPRQLLIPITSSNSHLVKLIASHIPSIEICVIDRKFFNETNGALVLKEFVCNTDRSTVDILISAKYLSLASVDAVLHYVQKENGTVFLPNSLHVEYRTCEGYLMLDPMTIRSLELVEPLEKRKKGTAAVIAPRAIKSLFDVLKHTQTEQGTRLLRMNLLQPPSDMATIQLRQSCVLELLSNEDLYFSIGSALLAFSDTEPLLYMLVRSSSATETPTAPAFPSSSLSKSKNRMKIPHAGPTSGAYDMKFTLSTAQNHIITLLKLKKCMEGIDSLCRIVSTSSHPFFIALKGTLSHPDLQYINKLLSESMSDVSSQILTFNSATAPQAADQQGFPPAPQYSMKPSNFTHRKAIQQKNVIYALKEGVNGLLDAARRVYHERMEDIQNLFGSYRSEFPHLSLTLSRNLSRGYFLSILETTANNRGSGCDPTDLPMDMSDDEVSSSKSDPFETDPHSRKNLFAGKSRHCMLESLPDIFILRSKQGQRLQFTTEDLIALNSRLQQSINEIILITSKLLLGVQSDICARIGCIYKLTDSIALLDLMFSFATYVTLSREPCCRPDINNSGMIQIVRGFHPILLAQSPPASGTSAKLTDTNKAYPTNIVASKTGCFMHLITGRNNSGKTTYLLQVATLAILAHIGCLLPAKFASLCLLDRILTRIPTEDLEIASPDPMTSSSAFFNEMKETAYILNSATSRSLVLLDELGKSTSNDDGVPLCLSICEQLIAKSSFTFFATHWLDMARKLQDMYSSVIIHRMLVGGSTLGNSEYAIAEGCEEDSGYGIEMAASAGWPFSVIESARKIRDSILQNPNSRSTQSFAQSHRSQVARLKALVIEQLRITKHAKLDPVALHVFLHTLAMRYRDKMNELEQSAPKDVHPGDE